MNRSNDLRGAWAALFGGLFLGWYAVSGPTAAAGPQCVDFSKDPAGCQPSTFKTPMAQMPTVRVNRQGAVDPTSSEEDDRELRSLVYKTSGGDDRYILVRNGGTNTIGRMETYRIDMNTCLPTSNSEITDFHSQSHEFFLWHDPANPNRVLVYMAILDRRPPPTRSTRA